MRGMSASHRSCSTLISPSFKLANHGRRNSPSHRFGGIEQMLFAYLIEVIRLVHAWKLLQGKYLHMEHQGPHSCSSKRHPDKWMRFRHQSIQPSKQIIGFSHSCAVDRYASVLTKNASSSIPVSGSTAIFENRMRKMSFRASKSGGPT